MAMTKYCGVAHSLRLGFPPVRHIQFESYAKTTPPHCESEKFRPPRKVIFSNACLRQNSIVCALQSHFFDVRIENSLKIQSTRSITREQGRIIRFNEMPQLGFMATAAVKLPPLCRSFVGAVEKNAIVLRCPRQFIWSWHRGAHGLPDDGSVICLRNSTNGAQVYLVGSCHVSEKSALLVKQVELCERRAKLLLFPERKKQSFIELCLHSWQVPGSHLKKLLHFFFGWLNRQLKAIGFEVGKEFKVAMGECNRLGARIFFIDQDVEVTIGKLQKALSFNLILRLAEASESLEKLVGNIEYKDAIEKYGERNFVRKATEIYKTECPEIARVMITERDQMMFERLRKCKGKVVAVVGMGHMDGIEQMWKGVEHNLVKNRING